VPARIVCERIAIRAFRNLAQLDFEPASGLNVISGDNGHGKTSVLEALYFISTSKSFRASRLVELVQQGSDVTSVRATFVEGGQAREQRAAITHGHRALSIDGKKPARLAGYATRTPVVAFHPGDLELVSGGATRRRMLLDRVALFLEPASVDDRQNYELSLRQRQRALEQAGPGAAESSAFEALVADYGVRLARARRIAAERLIAALGHAFSRLVPSGIELGVRYAPGGTEDPDLFRAELNRRQASDARRGLATFGPHRDELELELDRRTARRHGSQGQQRILTLALKLAELECVREARRAHPLLLLDDVSSELDQARTGAVYDLVRAEQSQVFVTTTRPELLSRAALDPGERADFVIEAGTLRRE